MQRIEKVWRYLRTLPQPVEHDHNGVPLRDADPSFWGQPTELHVLPAQDLSSTGPLYNWDEVKTHVEESEYLSWDVLEYKKGTNELVNIYVTRPVFLQLDKTDFIGLKEVFDGFKPNPQ